VTGGAGFIGSHMVDLLLDRGFEIRVLDNLVGGHKSNLDHHKANKKLTCYWEDIRHLQPSSPIFDRADYVFHFAGIGDIVPSIEAPSEYMDVNVQGTVRVLECARLARVRKFVYAASSSCYGLASTPTSEDHPIDPQYPYALSKYQGEQAVFHWHKVYQLPASSICIFNAYGTRVRTTGVYGAVFGVFLKQKLAGKPFTVVGMARKVAISFMHRMSLLHFSPLESNVVGSGSMSAPETRRPSIASSGCSVARLSTFLSAPASQIARSPISEKSAKLLAGNRKSRLRTALPVCWRR
jgi:nucleoside-diphosphate-sugar epimerase